MRGNIVSVIVLVVSVVLGGLDDGSDRQSGVDHRRRGARPARRAIAEGRPQWERAIVLRLGKYVGLRGPGLFWIVPFIDTRARLHRSARDHDGLRGGADAHRGHRAGQRRRGPLLDGARPGEGRARSAELLSSGELGRADRAARHHRPHVARRPAARAASASRRSSRSSSTAARTRGASPCNRSRCATSSFPRRSRTRCRARRRRRARSRRASSSARPRSRSRRASQKAAQSYQNNPTALHLRAMNMLYEGLKEKGALMLVPSSAVESMGMGGLMGCGRAHATTTHVDGNVR